MTVSNPFLTGIQLFSALSFLFFGFSCLYAPFLKLEFKRYGLVNYRRLTGFLQLLGALALVLGFYYKPLALAGSIGLSILMFMGLAVRIKIKDSIRKSLPAAFYAVLNLLLFIWLLKIHNV